MGRFLGASLRESSLQPNTAASVRQSYKSSSHGVHCLWGASGFRGVFVMLILSPPVGI